jgi:molecular chaperone GrpE
VADHEPSRGDSADRALPAAGGLDEDAQAGIGLEDQVEKLRADLAEANDRALRAHAELENYRKRVRRDMEEERKYADLPLLRDLLPVVDNLVRALEAGEKTHDAGKLLAGVRLVAQQLENVFSQHHCRRIEALGQHFDPHLHQAIAQQPSDQPPGTVLVDAQPGYQLHERVLRPSQVIVSQAQG